MLKCTKIYNARVELLFCSFNLLFCGVLVAVVVCLSSLMFCSLKLLLGDIPVAAVVSRGHIVNERNKKEPVNDGDFFTQEN